MNIRLFLSKINFPIALVILIPILLTLIWFRQGNIMAVAEAGVPFYDFQRQYNISKDAWANYALGYPTNISVAAIPTNWLLAYLQNIGIDGFILQAVFFWVTFVVSGISIYLITKNLFPELGNRFVMLSVLFYWFNPFSMVNVWNRFLNNFFVFYMLMPVTLLFFLKGLQTRRYFYAFSTGLVSTILAYALTSMAFNLLLWLVLFYTAAFYVFVYKGFKERLFVVCFLLFSLLFWGLTNIWWISQAWSYFYSGSFSLVEKTSFPPANNQQILTILSQKLGNLIYILKFQHASFFSDLNDLQWVKLYTFSLFSFLSFAIPIIIFLPLVTKRAKWQVLFLSGLTLLGILLSKGNNPPFGEFFNLIFSRIGFLQTLRNPFEKFGFILPLSSAPLLAYGCYIIQEKIGRRWRTYIYLIFILWLVGIFGLPFWTGLVFTSNESPTNILDTGYQVKVPAYYKAAADWLRSQGSSFRLLVFPIGGEGITYTWEKGFTGVELSNQLLPVTSVSFQTNIPFYENISGDLERIFLTKQDFTKVTNMLNTKYIVSRADIDWRTRGMRNPQTIFNRLKENSQFKLIKNFGALIFWENPNFVDKKIYSSVDAVSISPRVNLSYTQFTTENDLLLEDNIQLKDIVSAQQILHPVARFSLGASPDRIFITGQEIFPHIRFSPGSKVYKLILLKEQFELNAISFIPEKIRFGIQLLGKRLVEAKAEAELGSEKNVLTAIREYENLLKKLASFFPEYSYYFRSDFDKQLLKQEDFYNIFHEHKKILKDLINHFSTNKSVIEKIENIQKLLESVLVDVRIQPTFGFKEENNFPIKSRVLYKFNVKDAGEYELLWGDSSLDKYFKKNTEGKILLQIDDRIVSVQATYKELDLRSFGKIYFNPGIHEIAVETEEGINLVDVPKEINLQVKHGVTTVNFPIKNYDPFASYTVSLDYWVKMGSGAEVSVVANNAKLDLGEIVPDFSKVLGSDNYDFGEKHFSAGFRLNSGADSADLIFKAKPWNDCESIFFTRGKDRCQDESFRYPYDRTTEVIIKNISVTRNLVDKPILIKSDQRPFLASPTIEFEKIDDTKYSITVTDAKNPFILVFSELFDAGWRIFTTSGDEITGQHFVVNGYANGWEIDKTGNYKLILKYSPQDLLKPTEKISQAMFILGAFFVIWSMRRKNVKTS